MSSLFYVENLVEGILQKGSWYITILKIIVLKVLIKKLTGLPLFASTPNIFLMTDLTVPVVSRCSAHLTNLLSNKTLNVLPKSIQLNNF